MAGEAWTSTAWAKRVSGSGNVGLGVQFFNAAGSLLDQDWGWSALSGSWQQYSKGEMGQPELRQSRRPVVLREEGPHLASLLPLRKGPWIDATPPALVTNTFHQITPFFPIICRRRISG